MSSKSKLIYMYECQECGCLNDPKFIFLCKACYPNYPPIEIIKKCSYCQSTNLKKKEFRS